MTVQSFARKVSADKEAVAEAKELMSGLSFIETYSCNDGYESWSSSRDNMDSFITLIKRAKEKALPDGPDVLNSSEAVMAFLTWLTSRSDKVSFGENEECSVAVELYTEFTDHNRMPYLRANYTDYFSMPPVSGIGALSKKLIND